MFHISQPTNEKTYTYEPGSRDRDGLKLQLDRMAQLKCDIPSMIDGHEVSTGEKRSLTMPHDHQKVIADYYLAGPTEMQSAIDAALKAKPMWEAMPWHDRAAIFLKAADIIAGPYRNILLAATMLGQSKNVHQAEIDAACELADFFRFNAFYYQEILKNQPQSSPGIWNQLEYRPLEGFVLAITPFNFTAIAGNLPAAPALMGNTVIWKPTETQLLSAHYTMQALREAGLPPGVINLVVAEPSLFGSTLLPHPHLAGVHFTGSTRTFQHIWQTIGQNIGQYRSYPRIVGETGGKGFVFAHPSADPEALAIALVRGAFEYQGQKCSAASRAYIPKNLWRLVQDRLKAHLSTVTMGDVRDFRHFVNAVIDDRAFKKCKEYLDHASNSPDAKVVIGGKASSEKGYFIEPTVIWALQPNYKSMVEEIFGPILTVYLYEEAKFEETLAICDETSPYSLTGAIFAKERKVIQQMASRLRHSAGNLYINDKPTGAVVGQQPFGGGRTSGTNDKAGSALNLYRWLSPRTIKEVFVPPVDYRYPSMGAQ